MLWLIQDWDLQESAQVEGPRTIADCTPITAHLEIQGALNG